MNFEVAEMTPRERAERVQEQLTEDAGTRNARVWLSTFERDFLAAIARRNVLVGREENLLRAIEIKVFS